MESKNVLPTETENGMFGDRETRFAICDCGCMQHTSFFIDDNEVCWEQTDEMRARELGIPTEIMELLSMFAALRSASRQGPASGSSEIPFPPFDKSQMN